VVPCAEAEPARASNALIAAATSGFFLLFIYRLLVKAKDVSKHTAQFGEWRKIITRLEAGQEYFRRRGVTSKSLDPWRDFGKNPLP
jgi:hypothetical protein